jgi:hypothetical protein
MSPTPAAAAAPATPVAEKPATPPVAEKPAAAPPADKPIENPPAEPVTPPAEPPAAAIPEPYVLTIPDSAKTFLEQADLAPIVELARELKLDTAAAQALVDQHVEVLQNASAAFRTTTENDTDYGGPKLEETTQLSNLVLDQVRPAGTPRGDGLRRLLARSGYGNHIEVVSFLADLGRMMREDTPVGGGRPAAGQMDAAEKLYGGTTPK